MQIDVIGLRFHVFHIGNAKLAIKDGRRIIGDTSIPMHDLQKYFDAAYVINLPHRKDRLEGAKKEFARIGWEFGTQGVQLYEAKTFTDRAGFPFPGSRGCFHSHSECIRSAYKEGRNSVLVMEDDIALSPAFKESPKSLLKQLSSLSWDFLYLGHEDTGPIGRAISTEKQIEFVTYKGGVRGAHCYAVNGRIFSRLLAHLDRVANGIEGDQEFGPMPIDGAFNIFRRNNSDVKTLIAAPKLSWQRSTRSDNHPKAFDNIKVLRPLVSMVRHLRSTTLRWYS